MVDGENAYHSRRRAARRGVRCDRLQCRQWRRPVGEASRRKVLEAIAALDYRLDRAASALRGRSTRLVGMVVPDITNVFFASLVHGVEALAERDGYDLLIVSTGEDATKERRRVEALVARRIDGLIVVPVTTIRWPPLGRARRGRAYPRRC